MDLYEEGLEQANRVEKVKIQKLNIRFTTPIDFEVLDETKKIKYIGYLVTVRRPPFCTCPDFFHRNNERYQATHSEPFECKHILRAKEYLK